MTSDNIEESLTFDDILLLPNYSEVTPNLVKVNTKLTNKIELNIPMVSAAMDTVTEAELAIAIAQEGGLGFIHKNMSFDRQIEEVKKVKSYESGMITKPITVREDTLLKDLLILSKKNGFAGYPVVNNSNDLTGIITNRDVVFIGDLLQKINKLMTPKDKLITIEESEISEDKVKALMQSNKVEKILVVDSDFKLKGLITAKDFIKSQQKPNACKDTQGRLRVGVALKHNSDQSINYEYIERLIDAGIDILLLDSSHGHSKTILTQLKQIKYRFPDVDVVAGNIATVNGAKALIDNGADAVKVGIGPGSICTTRIVTGVGVPQITAIMNAVKAAKDNGTPIIADGGIRYSGDIAKALAVGASSVMTGSLLAGLDETPGEIEIYQGRTFKSYRGMGSIGAMQKGSADRYFQESAKEKLVPEGIEGRVPYKGKLADIITQYIGGLRSAMGLTGNTNITDFRHNCKITKISPAGYKESHVHDVYITKESPNYRLG